MKGLTRKQWYVPLAILLVCMFLITGCGESATTTPTNPAATTTPVSTTPVATQTSAAPITASAAPTDSPQYGGKVTRGEVGSPINIGCPGKRGGPFDMGFTSPCIESLIDSSYGEYIPRLAESWEIAEDGNSITFKIRQGVKFHDGTDLNAEAVKINFDTVRNLGELTTFRNVTSIDVVDEYTLRLNLTQFDWGIMSALATGFAGKIFSAKAIKENTPEELIFRPIGTGPFKFISYQKDTLIKYERFEDYWQEGKPYLDTVDIKVFADYTTATMAMKAGEVDLMIVSSAEDMLDMKKSGFNIREYIGRVGILYPDGANPDSPFSDIRVRQALSHAIDRQTIADSLGYGYYYPTYQLVGEWSEMSYNPNIIGQPYDPDKARQLLAEAGYPNGFKTEIITGVASDLHLAIQDMLAEVGIKAEIQEVTGAKYSELSFSGWHNGMLYSLTPLGSGHQDPSQNFSSSYLSTLSLKSVYKPDDVMALFEQAKIELDPVKRKALFQDIIKKVVDDYCLVTHIYNATEFYAISPDIYFPEITSFCKLLGKMEDVWRIK